jgi:hypothetical protein
MPRLALVSNFKPRLRGFMFSLSSQSFFANVAQGLVDRNLPSDFVG